MTAHTSEQGELPALRRAILAQAVQEALEGAEGEGLRGALEAAWGLEAVAGLQAAAAVGPPSSAAAARPQQRYEWLAGDGTGLLGVQVGDLGGRLPCPVQIEDAARQLLPSVEARLVERCGQVAAAAGYDGCSSSYDALPSHLQQLCVGGDRRAGVESWGRAAGSAQQALQLLGEVNDALIAIVAQHKLGSQKEADAAHAAYLHAQCAMLLEKLRVVEAQLRGATYTQATLPALRRAARQLEAAVGEAEGKLRQASTRLAQCQALGPRFEALAREHAEVVQRIGETQYQLQEVEQFAQLQQVIG